LSKKIDTHPGLLAEQKFTTPPPRYGTATLATLLEKKQLVRPSTFASSIKTLKDREYIISEKKSYKPTELGMRVVDFLVEANMCFVDGEFTARMEHFLDEVADGKKNKVEVLSEFWNVLKLDIENGNRVRDSRHVSEHKCPKCNSNLLLKHSQYGPFFSCSNYKEKNKKKKCDYKANVGKNGEPAEKVKKEQIYADFDCRKCGSRMIKRKSRFGEFAGCEKYPTCKETADLDGNFKDPSKKKKWKNYKKR